MPTGESKSASRHHHKSSSSSSKKSKKHKKSSEHDRNHLPRGVSVISEDDYFLRATEFRVWLAKTKCVLCVDLCRIFYCEWRSLTLG